MHLLIKNALCCKIDHKSAHFSILHTDAHARLDDNFHTPQATFPHKCFQASHNMEHGAMVRSTEERFATERMATRGFGAKKIATTLGLPQSTTKRWCLRGRFLRVAQKRDTAPRQIAKTRHLTPHLTPWHSPQKTTAPQRQTTRGKTLPHCDASRTKNFDLLNLKMAKKSPKP